MKTKTIYDPSDDEIANNLNSLTDFYVKIIDSYHKEKNDFIKKHIKKTLHMSLKEIDGISRIKCSEKARQCSICRLNSEIDRNNITGNKKEEICEDYDIREIPWAGQTLAILKNGLGEENRNSKTKIFHWEHAYPLGQMRDDLLSQNIYINGEVNRDKVENILKKHQVIWITREENYILNSKGYSKKRPKGWEVAYKECGIEIYED